MAEPPVKSDTSLETAQSWAKVSVSPPRAGRRHYYRQFSYALNYDGNCDARSYGNGSPAQERASDAKRSSTFFVMRDTLLS